MDVAEALDTFRRNGYAVLTGQLRQHVPALTSLFDRLATQEEYVSGQPPSPAYFIKDLIERAPEITLPAILDPDVLTFAELVIGPFVQLDGCVVARFIPQPGDATRIVEWHRDRFGYVPACYDPPRTLVAISYLTDMRVSNGPLRVLPGSHAAPITLTDTERYHAHPHERLLTVDAGDLVLLHHNLLHSGTWNKPDLPRLFFSVTFNHSGLRQDDNFSGPNVTRLRAAATNAGDVRLLRLLGTDPTLHERVNSGFTRPAYDDWATWSGQDDTSRTTGRRSPTIGAAYPRTD